MPVTDALLSIPVARSGGGAGNRTQVDCLLAMAEDLAPLGHRSPAPDGNRVPISLAVRRGRRRRWAVTGAFLATGKGRLFCVRSRYEDDSEPFEVERRSVLEGWGQRVDDGPADLFARNQAGLPQDTKVVDGSTVFHADRLGELADVPGTGPKLIDDADAVLAAEAR